MKKFLCYKIPKKDTVRILTNLGLETETVDPETYKVKVPAFRPDIEREIDLIEEVATCIWLR